MNVVKSYHFCNTCDKKWYSADNWGFAKCPYCNNVGTGVMIDDPSGKLGLSSFRGADYQLNKASTERKEATGIE
jgi:hypothetical protein